MKSWLLHIPLCILLLAGTVHAEPLNSRDHTVGSTIERTDDSSVQELGYRSGRGGYTGGRSGYTPGTRTGGGSYNTVPRTPATAPGGAATAPRTGYPGRTGWGSFFGGLAAGSLLGSLLHPFGLFGGYGYGYGAPFGGFSIIGILFWGAVLFFIIRWIVRKRNTRY